MHLTTGKKVGLYLKIILWLLIGGYAALYLAGLIPQAAVNKSVQLSASQLEEEGYAPVLLIRSDESYKLDNFTETRILLESLYMDTRTKPQAIFINPTYEGGGKPIEAINAVADSGAFPEPDSYFVQKHMGFRAVIRPLLSLMNLRQIRRLIMWGVLLLFVANAINIRERCGTLIALLFTASFLSINPIAVMSSMQYACCFLLAFAAMLLLPRVIRRQRLTEPMAFFIIGALTQYFDIYTTPLITFGMPFLISLLVKQQDGDLLTFQADIFFLVKCLGAWLSAYVFMWVANIAVVEIATDFPAWRLAIADLAECVGVGNKDAQPLLALSAGITNLITIECTLCLIGFIIAWPFMMDTRKKRATGYRQGRIFLIVALLPLIWCMVGANSMLKNAYYQYRMLIVTIFAALCFYAKPTQYLEKNMQKPL